MEKYSVVREKWKCIYKVTLERDGKKNQDWYIVSDFDEVHNIAKIVHDWFNNQSPDDPDTHIVSIENISSDIVTITEQDA